MNDRIFFILRIERARKFIGFVHRVARRTLFLERRVATVVYIEQRSAHRVEL